MGISKTFGEEWSEFAECTCKSIIDDIIRWYKVLDGFNVHIKPPERLQPKRFESILHPNPLIGYCILHEEDLDCYD